MKYFCLDRDSCGYTFPLSEEDYATEDFSSPFKNCPQCNYYILIVEDSFDIFSQESLPFILTATKKVFNEDD